MPAPSVMSNDTKDFSPAVPLKSPFLTSTVKYSHCARWPPKSCFCGGVRRVTSSAFSIPPGQPPPGGEQQCGDGGTQHIGHSAGGCQARQAQQRVQQVQRWQQQCALSQRRQHRGRGRTAGRLQKVDAQVIHAKQRAAQQQPGQQTAAQRQRFRIREEEPQQRIVPNQAGYGKRRPEPDRQNQQAVAETARALRQQTADAVGQPQRQHAAQPGRVAQRVGRGQAQRTRLC